MPKKDLVLIPFWIKDILRRNNLPLKACLELSVIKPLLSQNDLATFVAVNNTTYLKKIIDIDGIYFALEGILIDSILKSNVELKTYLYDVIFPLACDKSIINELENRLFKHNDHYISIQNNVDKKYDVVDLTPDVFGLVLHPHDSINKQEVITDIIELLYSYMSFHQVAKTPFFKGYLKTLQENIL